MTPLEGLKDYVDVSVIVNWPQATVACVALFALLIWPQLSARQTAKRIEKSITTNNGGGSVKDRFDKLEKLVTDHIEWSEGYVKEQDERLDKLEAKPSNARKRRLTRSR